MANRQKCRWCKTYHAPRLLCDQAKRILDALYARGMEGDMPTIEFPEPIPANTALNALGLNPGDRLVSQLVVKAAVVPALGTAFPALVFTGRDPYGEVLPQWLVAFDGPEGVQKLIQLVTDTGEMATRRAAQAAR